MRERVLLVSCLGQSDGVHIVVSCDHESGLCMCLCLFFKMYIRRCLLSHNEYNIGVRGNLERVVLALFSNK